MVGRTGDLDRRIGGRVRAARLLKGISQGKLSASLGITFQQVQKYERGTNRISASTLLKIAEVLEMDLLYFFYGDLPVAAGYSAFSEATAIDFEILRGLTKVKNKKTKRRIADLVETLGS